MSDYTRFTAWIAGVVAVLNLVVFAGGGLAGWSRWWWLLMAAGWALIAWGNVRLARRQREKERAGASRG